MVGWDRVSAIRQRRLAVRGVPPLTALTSRHSSTSLARGRPLEARGQEKTELRRALGRWPARIRPMRLASTDSCREALSLLSAALWGWVLSADGWAPAAWFALAPLFAAVHGAGGLRGGLCGALWAVAATLGVAWWLPGTAARFFEMTPSAAWGAFALLSRSPLRVH